jgi:alpha-D-xyloside xylohydrolase
MDFRNDAEAHAIGDQFLFGPSLLVNPVTDPGVNTRRLYVPQGTWYNFWTGQSVSGPKFITAPAPLDTLPLYVRAGSILPLGPVMQYTGEKPADPIELRIYGGGDGDFTLYEDDGETYSYEKGAYATIPMHWSDSTKTLTIGERQGSFPAMLRLHSFNIIRVGEGHGNGLDPTQPVDKTVQYDGKAVSLGLE